MKTRTDLILLILSLVSFIYAWCTFGWLACLCFVVSQGMIVGFVFKRRKTHPGLWKIFKAYVMAPVVVAMVFLPLGSYFMTPRDSLFLARIIGSFTVFSLMAFVLWFLMRRVEQMLDNVQ